MNVVDTLQINKEDTLVVGKCNSKRVWLPLLIISIALIALSLFALSKTNTAVCFASCIIAFVLSLAGTLVYIRDSRVKFEVTSKCIHRQTALGRHIYLPIDSICAVCTNRFNCVAVYTNYGKFGCTFLGNSDEVFIAIKNILDERQNNK